MKTKIELPTNVLSKSARIGKLTRINLPTAKPFKTPANMQGLYPYQKEGVLFLRSRTHCVLADEPGLGKTAQAIRALTPPAIILCPASLRLVWRDEIEKFRPSLYIRYASSADDMPVPYGKEVVIVSHDSLDLPLTDRRLVERNLKHVTLIPDEGHRFKNESAERTFRARALAEQCGKVWVLTGTPMFGNPDDLQGVLELALVFGKAFGSGDSYRKAFGYDRRENPPWPAVPPDPKWIQGRIDPYVLRRTKAEVLPDLPKKSIEVISCPVPDTLLTRLRLLDDKWHEIGSSQCPPFEMLSQLRHELAKSRITTLTDYVDACERKGETSLLVFADHLDPLFAFSNRKGWGVMTGATPLDERDRLVKRFESGKLKGLALSIKVGGVGFTLTRASHGIFASLSYTPDENTQCADRMVRIGQKARNVRLTYLVSDHPLDRRLLEIHAIKEQRNAAVFA